MTEDKLSDGPAGRIRRLAQVGDGERVQGFSISSKGHEVSITFMRPAPTDDPDGVAHEQVSEVWMAQATFEKLVDDLVHARHGLRKNGYNIRPGMFGPGS